MAIKVTYGEAESCEIALGDHTLLAPNGAGVKTVLDVAAAVQAALASPIEYPPLAAAVVPGDRAAIALGRDVPHAPEVVRAAVEALVAAGVEAGDVTVVSVEPFGQALHDAVSAVADDVHFSLHDPNDEQGIAMVGLTAARRPLRLNRTLAEADFVLPIGAARSAGGDGAPAHFTALFPRFSNRETVERFHGRIHGRGKSAGAQKHVDRGAEADEAAWLLGVGMVVVVVPGPGETVADIVAGTPAAAARVAAERLHAIWDLPTARQGDLVIAALAGGTAQQTWGNLARAVAASERVLSPEGAIAVCCELEEHPGRAFDKLLDAVDFSAVAQRLRADSAEDARPARILAQALERGPVYLMSRLPADVVESLGMTPIESEAELSRLAAGRRHCVVIEEAQRVRPRLVGGAERA